MLILSTFDTDAYVYAGFRAGASGFLLKTVEPVDLVHAVRTVARGDSLLAPTITRRLVEEFTRRPLPTDGTPEQLSELTERELDVLRTLAKGLSNCEAPPSPHETIATRDHRHTRPSPHEDGETGRGTVPVFQPTRV